MTTKRLLALLPLTALLSLTGCGTPPALPALAPGATGTLVHVSGDDPSLPLALYRMEPDLSPPPPRSGRGSAPRPGPHAEFGIDSSPESDAVPRYVPRLVCLAPCDQRVEDATGEGLFLGGEGVRPSSHFHLPLHAASVTITASPKRATVSTVGTVLVPAGSVSLLAGLVLVPAMVSAREQSPGSSSSSMPVIAGGVLMGVGALLLAVGIPLLATGSTTYSLAQPGVAWRF